MKYPPSKMYEELIEKEKMLLTSTLRGDLEAVEKLMADDFIEIGMTGTKFDKQFVLSSLERWDYLEYEGKEFETRELREGLVQIVYKALVKNKKANTETWTRRSSIWEEKEGVWKMIFHQGTKVEEGGINHTTGH